MPRSKQQSSAAEVEESPSSKESILDQYRQLSEKMDPVLEKISKRKHAKKK